MPNSPKFSPATVLSYTVYTQLMLDLIRQTLVYRENYRKIPLCKIDRNSFDGFNFGSVENNCQMANFNSMPTFPAFTIWYNITVFSGHEQLHKVHNKVKVVGPHK